MGIRLVAPAHCFERFHTKHYESDMSRFPLQGPTRLSSLRICMSKYSSGGEVETPPQKLKEIRIPFSIVSVAQPRVHKQHSELTCFSLLGKLLRFHHVFSGLVIFMSPPLTLNDNGLGQVHGDSVTLHRGFVDKFTCCQPKSVVAKGIALLEPNSCPFTTNRRGRPTCKSLATRLCVSTRSDSLALTRNTCPDKSQHASIAPSFLKVTIVLGLFAVYLFCHILST